MDKETILVVDDNDSFRDLVREVLTEHGFRVSEAVDGADAALPGGDVPQARGHGALPEAVVTPAQHRAVPPESNAQLWYSPAATSVPPPSRPATSDALGRLLVVPSPSCPNLLSPHAHTVPSDLSARL